MAKQTHKDTEDIDYRDILPKKYLKEYYEKNKENPKDNENEKIGNMTWSKWAEGLEAIGADLIQCSTDHDSGQQLLGMGGAIALLRYRMDG